MNKMMEKIRNYLRRWLGIIPLENAVERQARGLDKIIDDFNSQMKMVGVDVHLRNGVQTRIIFVSSLGYNGDGTIKVVDAHFKNLNELRHFIKSCEEGFKRADIYIDAPPGLGRELRRSW